MIGRATLPPSRTPLVPIRLTFLGAAGTVTGSCTLVETPTARVLVDCGLHQGDATTERIDRTNRLEHALDGRPVDAVVLTHAHIDHAGRLPLLEKLRLGGPIHCTEATAELVPLLLRDSAMLQALDARSTTRLGRRIGTPDVEPLHSIDDADAAIARLRPVRREHPESIADGVTVAFRQAAHIVGSASALLTVRDGESERRLLFSGDLGPMGMPHARRPQPAVPADLVVLESTYGDRDHRTPEATLAELGDVVESAVTDSGTILIPAFAVGRAQTILLLLARIVAERRLPEFPVYLDSPMAIAATEIQARWIAEIFDDETLAQFGSDVHLPRLPELHLVRDGESSRKLNGGSGPRVIVATSGMCTGGRILHHLRHGLPRADTHVLFVGYQGVGTLGRTLVDGAREALVLGHRVSVEAAIHTINGLSAHAGRNELLNWLEPLRGGSTRILLNHGEDHQRLALKVAIRDRLGFEATLPELGDRVTIG